MKPFLQKNSNKPRFEFPPRSSGEGELTGELLPARGIWTISDPNQNDVLCGRSNRLNTHSGNLQFKEIVDANRQRYMHKGTKKTEKANIAALIVNQIRSMDPSGRFLKEDSKTGLYFDIGDLKAIKKVGQELRKYAGSNFMSNSSCQGADIYSIQSISDGSVTQTNNCSQRNHENSNENSLNQDDFPVGRPYPFHPKIKLLNQMVDDLLAEYTEADKISKRTLGNGRELRSRHEIINLVVKSLTPGKDKFKKKQKDGKWVVDKNYSESKLRTRIINAFNNARDKHVDTQSAGSTIHEKMTIVTESTESVTTEHYSAAGMSNSTTVTAPSISGGVNSIYNSNIMSQESSETPNKTSSDRCIEKGGKIVFDYVLQEITSQYDDCPDHSTMSNFDLPFSKEELAPDIRMLDDISQTKESLPIVPTNPRTAASVQTTNDTCETMDGVTPMEFEFGRFFEPVEETMSVSDVSGLSSAIQSASTMSTISGMRSTISGMRSNLTGMRSNISGFTSNAESSNMGGKSRSSLTLASVFSTGKTHDTYSRRKRNKKR